MLWGVYPIRAPQGQCQSGMRDRHTSSLHYWKFLVRYWIFRRTHAEARSLPLIGYSCFVFLKQTGMPNPILFVSLCEPFPPQLEEGSHKDTKAQRGREGTLFFRARIPNMQWILLPPSLRVTASEYPISNKEFPIMKWGSHQIWKWHRSKNNIPTRSKYYRKAQF